MEEKVPYWRTTKLEIVEWKWLNKIRSAYKAGHFFDLSIDEYKRLLCEAGIKAEDVGPSGYHLARWNDEGGYTPGNCRFIWYLDNIRSRKHRGKKKRHSGHKKNLSPKEIRYRLRLIDESGIDVTKFGYVGRVADLLEIPYGSVRPFMEKHYKGNFYKREGSKVNV